MEKSGQFGFSFFSCSSLRHGYLILHIISGSLQNLNGAKQTSAKEKSATSVSILFIRIISEFVIKSLDDLFQARTFLTCHKDYFP
jgi:hypothetical protein